MKILCYKKPCMGYKWFLHYCWDFWEILLFTWLSIYAGKISAQQPTVKNYFFPNYICKEQICTYCHFPCAIPYKYYTAPHSRYCHKSWDGKLYWRICMGQTYLLHYSCEGLEYLWIFLSKMFPGNNFVMKINWIVKKTNQV